MPYNFDSKACLKNVYVKGICNNYKCDVEMFRQLKWWRRNWIAFYDSSSPTPNVVLLAVIIWVWPIFCFSYSKEI